MIDLVLDVVPNFLLKFNLLLLFAILVLPVFAEQSKDSGTRCKSTSINSCDDTYEILPPLESPPVIKTYPPKPIEIKVIPYKKRR